MTESLEFGASADGDGADGDGDGDGDSADSDGASADGDGDGVLVAGSQAGAGDDERICAGVVVYRTHAYHCEYISIALWWGEGWRQCDVC